MIVSGDKIMQKDRAHVRGRSSKKAAVTHLARLRSEVREAVSNARSIILIMGLPGAGKSTLAADLDAPSVLVIDTCAPTTGHREPLIRAAKNAKKPIDCYHVKTPIEICQERRPHVPPSQMQSIKARTTPPRRSEGFRRVCVIHGHNGTHEKNNQTETDRS